MDDLRSLLSLAAALQYPRGGYRAALAAALDELEGEALRHFMAFSSEAAAVDDDSLEELYTRTFDLNPVATLEVGWHLWGEQYERGRFLADLRAAQEAFGVASDTELPDHLTVLLPMLARMPAPNREQLVAAKLLPALKKIAMPLEESENPYRHLIRATRAALSNGGES